LYSSRFWRFAGACGIVGSIQSRGTVSRNKVVEAERRVWIGRWSQAFPLAPRVSPGMWRGGTGRLRDDPQSGSYYEYDVTRELYSWLNILRPSVARCVKTVGSKVGYKKATPNVAPKCSIRMLYSHEIVIIETQKRPGNQSPARAQAGVSEIWYCQRFVFSSGWGKLTSRSWRESKCPR
jgi:hypothetical protein